MEPSAGATLGAAGSSSNSWAELGEGSVDMEDSDMEEEEEEEDIDCVTADPRGSPSLGVDKDQNIIFEEDNQDGLTLSAGVKKKLNANTEHNKKERERRKVLKEAVTQLRKQLTKPTRKPVTIKVLEAAQQEIKELKAHEKRSIEKLEGLKKRENHLQWKLEELKKELSKLPDSEETPPLPTSTLQINVPSVSPDSLNTRGYPPSAAAAAQLSGPVPSPLPAAYIIARLPPATPTPTLMNFPVTPSLTPPPTTFLPSRLGMYPHRNSAFLQTSLFPTPQLPLATPPHLRTATPTNHHHQATHPASLQPPHSLASINNARPNPLPLPSMPQRTLGPTESYLMPPLLLGSQILAPPSLMTGITSLVGQRAFPSLLLPPDHLLYQPNPYTAPPVDAAPHKEATYQLAPATAMLGSTDNASDDAAIRHSLDPAASASKQNVLLPSQHAGAKSSTEGNPQKEKLLQEASYHLPQSEESSAELAVVESEGEENNSRKCSNQDSSSMLTARSLPDDDAESNDSYSWGRKKRRRKRKRQEYPNSSDSESEGSCSSNHPRRPGTRRTRNTSSHSSASSSDSSRKNEGSNKNGKKCSDVTTNDKLSCMPPLLRVPAAELMNCPLQGCSVELVSECDIVVSANSSYSPNEEHVNEYPPCPDLERLPPEPEVATTFGSHSTVIESEEKSSPQQDLHSWTEAIIEESMSQLKKKFVEVCPTYSSHGNYSHPTNPPHPILLA